MQRYSKTEIAITALLRAKQSFEVEDWISSTILAGAAQQVLRDLCEARGLTTAIETVSASIGHQVNDVHRLIASSYNGMKHANRDHDKYVTVSSAEPQALFVMAATDLVKLKPPYSSPVKEVLDFARSFK